MSRTVTLPPDAPPLADGARLGGWWHEAEQAGRIVCDLCPRECVLKPGDKGFCFVRENRDGEMVLTTYGRSTGFCVDPIEKKPLNHFYPGTSVLSFGTAGCNLGCKFCQNHDISKARKVEKLSEHADPETIARAAKEIGCRSVAFTYNDPVIWAEYAIDTARACRAAGLKSVAVTAGYITPEARGPFYHAMDAANVDLKAFTEEFYYRLTLSHLQPVLDTLQWLKEETDVWFEITNLIIPQANDSPDDLRRMCDWILERVGDEVPVHFTAFHPDFKMTDRPRTPIETLLAAWEQARRCGFKYPYVGNVNDVKHQSTYCGGCGKLVIERDWHQLGSYELDHNRCVHCGHTISGHFDERPGDWGRRRLPVQISKYAPAEPSLIPSSSLSMPTRPTTASQRKPTMPETTAVSAEPIELDAAQQQAIHQAACELLEAAVMGRPPQLPDPTLAGLADRPLMGVFVSAKRHGRLRGCCGAMGASLRLADALAQSAYRTALEDVRLPPISPSELEHLEIEAWLLAAMKPVDGPAADRAVSIQVGRHGLHISRGNQSGLLLPGVPVENGWKEEEFLHHLCMKAGLPPTAWKEEDVKLQSFEGRALPGLFKSSNGAIKPASDKFTDQEMEALLQFARGNLYQLVQGGTPNYYLAGCSDDTVQGLTFQIVRNDQKASMHFSRIGMRPGSPMQATLFQLIDAAAKSLVSQGMTPQMLESVSTQVAVMYDAAMHGTLDDSDMRGFDPARRAVLAMERNKWAWVFDPQKTAEQLLADLAEKIDVKNLAATPVYSFRAQTTTAPMSVVNVPRGQRGAVTRAPGVAGTFYPGDAQELDRLVTEMLPSPEAVDKQPWGAVMAPHAGLIYSGKVAAEVFAQVDIPDTVIVIGPKHTPLGVDWAVAPHERWSLPGREVASDPELAGQLAQAIDGLELDAAAHQREHAIEVELPFLGKLAPQAKVVGIAVGAATLEQCRTFAEGLASVLKSRPGRTLLVISSDMNHFASDKENRRLDEMAFAAMETLDPESLYNTVQEQHISMCGMRPAVIVMETLKQLGGLTRCQRAGYATTADSTGDTSRVVGYAGMLLE